jgi:hypothetical protein
MSLGFVFPQQFLPMVKIAKVCDRLGRKLCAEGFIGHASVEMLCYPDPTHETEKKFFYGFDISLTMHEAVSVLSFFDFLT